MNKIIEIIPDDIPEWVQDAMDSGTLYSTLLDMATNYPAVCKLNEELEEARQAAEAQLEKVQWKVKAFNAMCEVGLIQFDPNIEDHCYSVWGFTCWHHDQDILKAIAAANEPVKMKAILEGEDES